MVHTTAAWFRFRFGLFALVLLLGATGWAVPAAAPSTAARSGLSLVYGQLQMSGKSLHEQDSAWVKLKLTYQIRRPGLSKPQTATSFPSSDILNTYYVDQMSEPPPTGKDSAGHSYTDYYFWYLCGPGATDVAMDFWPIPNDRHFGDHNYSDPHTTTNWNDTNFRSYLMYIADQVYPPWYTSPGEETFNSYPNAYTTFNDLRDAMNWEASGHNTSNWSNYFYVVVGAGSLSQNILLNDIEDDIYLSSVPPVVSVNDAYLPDWSHSGSKGTSHFVTIVGYDNTHGTYTYIETCTPASCGTSGTGQFTVSQQTLYNGIQNDNGNGGIVW